MNSVEKVRQALDRAEAIITDESVPAGVRAAATSLMLFRGKVEALIPPDPEQLDELLGRLSHWAMQMRSDPLEVPRAQ